jgi:Tfp pilus assembly protein FimV
MVAVLEPASGDAADRHRPPLTLVPDAPAAPAVPRWVVLFLAVAMAGTVAAGVARSVGGATDWLSGDVPSPPAGRPVHVVQPGETLWSIARTLHPDGDIRPLVDRLVELNGGDHLEVGQVLVLRW